ncbi:MAG TPA: AAA family ATPase [Acidimicrobiia bacterium]|nr:AAA family ATPase [Acidimicrobiia bacterium]
MIDELIVRNLGVIEEAHLDPGPGLTVITGETGTGKTLLLGALRLLLGGEARSDLVGPFADEAVAEGRFVDENGDEVGASRRLPRDGRSRAYLDGSIASARVLEERVAGLVDVVGQHDQLSLLRPGEARVLVDRLLDSDGMKAWHAYRAAWDALNDATTARRQLGGDRAALVRELDLVMFQSNEIDQAGFSVGDDAELARLGDRLRHADEIVSLLAGAVQALDTSRDAVGQAVAAVRKAAQLDGTLDETAGDLSVAGDGLGDLSRDLRRFADGVASDPEQLATVDARLTELGELKRKYGRTLNEVLAFGEEAARRRQEIEALLDRAGMIDDEVAAAEQSLARAGEHLREARRRAGDRLTRAAVSHLMDLGFGDPIVDVTVEDADPTSSGADTVRLLFASDSRLTPGAVAAVASGGELSRLVLSLRLAGGSGRAGTLVFDEIDAGIGGATALALGRKLSTLAEDRQVLCVTHLPQLAAFADRHYVVRRDGNAATVALVEGDGRLVELSRMLAGLPESARGREAAEELLQMANAG